MAKFLVTGGAGFIGSNIVKKLLEEGAFVRVFDNFSSGKRENLKDFFGNPNFELIEGDLKDLDLCFKSVRGIDFVLHQAAFASVPGSIEDPLTTNTANVTGTLNLLIAARDEGVKKFVYASSCAVYGNSPKLPKKENFPIDLTSPYALTKYVGEKYTQFFWQIYKLPTISLRYFNVFGPKQSPVCQYASAIVSFITALLKKEQPIIYGDGNQSRDFIFVNDVVEANLLAAKSKEGFGEVFNIASGQETTINQLLGFIQEIIGSKIKPVYKVFRPGDFLYSRADISKAKKILRFSPRVSLKKGLLKTIEWYQENGEL